jgi:putative PIN family toxin of toxin-antitoxin system
MGSQKIAYLVLDTNVVISAMLFGGIPGRLIELWKKGTITPLITEEIMSEYLQVLAYPKFDLSEDEINYIINQEILPFFKVVKSKPGPSVIKKDPDDDKFIQCAIAGKAQIIISGDHHLLALKSYKEINILTPTNFWKNLKNMSK